MGLFFINLRSITNRQIETNMQKTIDHVYDVVVARFESWSALLRLSAVGIAPLMAVESPDPAALRSFMERSFATQNEITTMYCSNNLVWNQSGGYAVYSDGTIPAADWDNTKRSWFTGAKVHSGEIAYSAPYISASSGQLVSAISINVYDELRRDLGVISGNVSVTLLENLLYKNSTLPEQQTYLLNKEGVFITNKDQTAVLNKNFFSETGLERYRNNVLSASSFSSIDDEVFIYSLLIPGVDWILVSTIPTSVVFTEVNRLLFIMLGVSIGILLLSALVTLIYTRVITKPFQYLKSFSSVIAGGDFSGTVEDYNTAEAAGLSRGFNTINERISALVKNITASFESMRAQGIKLEQVIEQSSAAAAEIKKAVNEVDNVDKHIKDEAGMMNKTRLQS